MSLSETLHPPVSNPIEGDRMLGSYFRWLPVLWLTGAYVLVMLAMVMRLAWRRWPTDVGINLLVIAWIGVAVAQALATLVNWADAGFAPSALPGLLLSVTIIGWGIFAVGLAAGFAWNLASATAVRSIMVLALWILVFGLIGQVYALTTGSGRLSFETPLQRLLGDSKAASFYTSAIFFKPETGNNRFILFFPWPTALSLAGICIILIATCERDLRWRMIGYAGGLFAVAFSFSRSGYVMLPMALAVLVFCRMPAFLRAACVAFGCAVLLGMTLAEVGPKDLIGLILERFAEARPGSSQARDLIYSESWRAFQMSPAWGWGWVGPSILAEEELPIGSHSTFFGTLYTGGLVTFGMLVLAVLSTLACALRALVLRPSAETAAALGILATFVLFSYGESFYSLVFPMMFAILFLGGALKHGTTPSKGLQ